MIKSGHISKERTGSDISVGKRDPSVHALADAGCNEAYDAFVVPARKIAHLRTGH
jgi:hypothetical protein